jgi:hypothetical protein
LQANHFGEIVMTKGKLLLGVALVSLPMVAGGLAIANSQKATTGEKSQQSVEKGYICPVTGEELACPHCCPLNGK